MKAVILAGGEGTRLRPLTLEIPKPVAPVVDRPFLRHQLDLLDAIGVREVVFSIAYRPEKIRAALGDGSAWGKTIEYVVEETPLGTGGAVKNAEAHLDGTSIVFNGDVLTDVPLERVLAHHRALGADATIVLTPVSNPSAYGLVEFDDDFGVTRFIEKPGPSEVTTDTINAGIYILEKSTLALMPEATKYSIERSFFPELLRRGMRLVAYVHRGYWIDIGTPSKYLAVHRDILRGRYPVKLDGTARDGGWVHESARVSEHAKLIGPFYIGPGCSVAAGAEVGAGATLCADVEAETDARIVDSVCWPGTRIGASSRIEGALIGSRVEIGEHVSIQPGTLLGAEAVLPPYTRLATGEHR